MTCPSYRKSTISRFSLGTNIACIRVEHSGAVSSMLVSQTSCCQQQKQSQTDNEDDYWKQNWKQNAKNTLFSVILFKTTCTSGNKWIQNKYDVYHHFSHKIRNIPICKNIKVVNLQLILLKNCNDKTNDLMYIFLAKSWFNKTLQTKALDSQPILRYEFLNKEIWICVLQFTMFRST